MRQLIKSFVPQDPVILQSMVIFKNARLGGKVDVHRDSTFLYTEPSSAIGFWFALEDCTTENGCLSFVPGSHQDGLCDRRMRRCRKDGSDDLSYEANGHMDLVFTGSERQQYDESKWVAAPVRAGSVVVIHGDVLHRSAPNHSDRSRNIYTFHCIDGSLPYSRENWLQWRAPFEKLDSVV